MRWLCFNQAEVEYTLHRAYSRMQIFPPPCEGIRLHFFWKYCTNCPPFWEIPGPNAIDSLLEFLPKVISPKLALLGKTLGRKQLYLSRFRSNSYTYRRMHHKNSHYRWTQSNNDDIFSFLFSELFPGFSAPTDGPTKLTVCDKLAINLESRAIVPGRLFRILIISV
jgi:hypothetical protein